MHDLNETSIVIKNLMDILFIYRYKYDINHNNYQSDH